MTARLDGGTITSDVGSLLLREVESKAGLLADLARCFDNFRDPELIEHSVEELIEQRVFALALSGSTCGKSKTCATKPPRLTKIFSLSCEHSEN